LESRPPLEKYQYTLDGKHNNLKNIANCIKSPVFGGSIVGTLNPIRKEIKDTIINRQAKGGYYVLKNVQKKENEPEFLDIWLLADSVKDKEAQLKMQSLHDLGKLNIPFWHKEMLYPYNR